MWVHAWCAVSVCNITQPLVLTLHMVIDVTLTGCKVCSSIQYDYLISSQLIIMPAITSDGQQQSLQQTP